MATDPGPIIVLGAGGHGRALAELANLAGCWVVGFLDAVPPALEVSGLPVWREELPADAGAIPPVPESARVALGVGDNAARLRAADRYRNMLAPALVHPRAWVSPSAELGQGTAIFPGALVHTNARIGIAVVINTGAIVEHDCEVGDGVHLAPGAILCGAVVVGQGAFIGANATVLPGCRIGAQAVVGAGAVVTASIGAGDRVVGVPARPMTGNS